MYRLLIIVGTVAAVATIYLLYDSVMIARCRAQSYEMRESSMREWIAHNWTKAARPHDDTALPNNMSVDQLTSERKSAPEGGLAFYTDESGGIAFTVFFDAYCDSEIDSEHCPDHKCGIGK